MIAASKVTANDPSLLLIMKVKVKVAQLCLTLCDPMDCGLPGSSVHGILQAGILHWVVIPFSRSSQPRDQTRSPTLQADSLTSELPGKPAATKYVYKKNNRYNLHACVLSHVQLFETLWTVAHQASLSMEVSKQEYWSGLPCPSPRYNLMSG